MRDPGATSVPSGRTAPARCCGARPLWAARTAQRHRRMCQTTRCFPRRHSCANWARYTTGMLLTSAVSSNG